MKRVIRDTSQKRVVRIVTAAGTFGALWAAAGAPITGSRRARPGPRTTPTRR